MGTIVNKTIQEATARLKENYEAQKIFDMSLGDCVPNRDAIISIIEGLRTVTFPGFFGSENMAYVSKDNFAGSSITRSLPMQRSGRKRRSIHQHLSRRSRTFRR